MYDEVLEMLHMGLQKVKTLPSLENKCFIGNFFTMHQYLARTYATLGDYEKSAFYTLATKMVRNQHSSYLRKTNTKEFKLEEKTFLDMKMISNKNIPMNDIYNVRASVHNQILALEEDNPIDQNEIRLFRMNCDINIEMINRMSEELRQEYTTIPQAAMSWKKLWAIFYYTYQLQQDHFPGDISLIIIILVCQHKMNILWKKIDKLFPKHENDRKIIHQINTGVPGSRCSSNQILEISKVEMNQSMSELEDSVIALKQELMHYTGCSNIK